MRLDINGDDHGFSSERADVVELGQVIVQLTRIWIGQEPDSRGTAEQIMAGGNSDPDDFAVVKDRQVQQLMAKLSEPEARSKKFETAFKKQQQELHELNSIIAQSRPKGDPFDDHTIRTKFGELESAIRRLVRRHFRDPQTTTGWTEYDEVIAADDKEFFLQAEIASYVADCYFGDNAPKRFGFGKEVDKALAQIEIMMESSDSKFVSERRPQAQLTVVDG